MATNKGNYEVSLNDYSKQITQVNTYNYCLQQSVVVLKKVDDLSNKDKTEAFEKLNKSISNCTKVFTNMSQVGAKFETQMTQVKASTGFSQEAIDKLSKSCLAVGISSGEGANKVAISYAAICKAMDTSKMKAEDLKKVQNDSITLSQASGLELSKSSTLLSSCLESFGAGASDSNKYINLLAATAKNSKLDINKLGDSLKEVGPTANNLGVSVEASASAFAILNKNNINGAKAGKELGAVYSIMSEKMNIDFSKVSLAEALDTLGPKINDSKAMTALFGKEHAEVAKYLYNNKESLTQFEAKVSGTNVATEQAAVVTNSWAFKLKQMNQVNESAQVGFTQMTGPLSGILSFLGKSVVGLGQVFTTIAGFKDAKKVVKDFFSIFSSSNDGVDKNNKSVKSYSKEMKKLSKSVGGNQRKFGSLMTKMKGFGKGLKAKSLGRITKKMKSMRKAIVGIAKAQKLKQLWDGIAAAKTKVMAVAQMVMNASMWACPVTWIVVGIIALVAVIYLLMTKVSGLSTLWSAAVNFMKHCFLAYICAIKLYFLTFLNGFMIGIDKIRIGWLKFKMTMGWGNQEENEKALADLEDNIEKRKKCIKDAAKDVSDHTKAAYDSKNMVHLSWKKDGSEEKEGSTVTSNGSEAGTQTESISNQTIQTSSQKIVSGGSDDKKKQININLNSLVDKIIFNGTLEEKAQDLEEQVTRIIHRVLLEANRI